MSELYELLTERLGHPPAQAQIRMAQEHGIDVFPDRNGRNGNQRIMTPEEEAEWSPYGGCDDSVTKQKRRVDQITVEPTLVRLSSVSPRKVNWLWPGRIPLGKYSMSQGDPGLGKSLLLTDFAARVSTGRPWPDGSENKAGGVVILSAEDDIDDTIVPRLMAAGADLERITALQSVTLRDADDKLSERSVSLATDLEAIEKAILQTPSCRLITIDPISAYVGTIDSHKGADVRGMLAPLSALAAKHDVAIHGATHLNKSNGGSALYRATGSLAFVAAARAVWLVARDKDDQTGRRRLFLPAKNNLADDSTGLAYEVRQRDLQGQPVIAWEENPVTVSADKALEVDKPSKPNKTDEACDWITHRLSGGRAPSDQLEQEALAAGITIGTYRRARTALNVQAVKDPDDLKWYSTLP